MSRLPPRCPLQKKNTTGLPINHHGSIPGGKDTDLHTKAGHSKSMSQSSVLDEQPSWLTELLNESDLNSTTTGIMHRRAASDSLTFFNGLEQNEMENPESCETDNGLESTCTYGPNSPRRKNKQSFPQNEIVSALSEYVMQNSVQNVDGHITLSGVPQMDSFGGTCASAGDPNEDARPMKRHPGQRSRVRKLQYIAELERTVNILQNLGSELSVRVASLLQQHVALSMENTTLKQHVLRMQQQKLLVDSEYQSLTEQLNGLKTGFVFSSNRNIHDWPKAAANFTRSESDAIWDMIDIGKLGLN